jgi:hypothetical protein
MTELTESQLAQLAYEMAINIRNYKTVFADFGITEEDYYEIARQDFFRKIKEQYTIEWNSVNSTADRVRMKGQAGSEILLPVMIKRAMDPQEPLPAAIEASKFVAKIGNLGEPQLDAKSAADRFIITINLGSDVETYNKSVAVDAHDVDPTKVLTSSKNE